MWSRKLAFFTPKSCWNGTRSLILGIESSCDDTGAAVIDISKRNIVAESLEKQSTAKYGGVIPTFAMKSHAIAVPKVVNEVLQNVDISNVKAVAVTNRPGLKGSLLIGRNYAQYLCYKFKKPMIPIHHMEAHALTVRLTEKVEFPFMVLLVSGGHCLLSVAKDIDDFLLLGQSTDTAPGEVLDKTARRLKLHQTFPELADVSGGKAIEIVGKNGDPKAFNFPQPLQQGRRDCMFSFAGLRTQAETWIAQLDQESLQPKQISDFCASLEYCFAVFLGRRLQRAIEFANLHNLWSGCSTKSIVVSGGVACNSRIRSAIQKVCEEYECSAIFPPVKYCTDNGVMIAWNGVEKWKRKKDIVRWKDVFEVDVFPRVPFGTDISSEVGDAEIKPRKIKF